MKESLSNSEGGYKFKVKMSLEFSWKGFFEAAINLYNSFKVKNYLLSLCSLGVNDPDFPVSFSYSSERNGTE